jgi:hypothetical protein
MNRQLHRFFTEDHHRLDQLLDKATESGDQIDMAYYHLFRTGLLRHIKMEENVLFPAAKKMDPELMQQQIPQYRKEHGALTALMVPPPTLDLIFVIRYLLERHDLREEEPGGMYDICAELTAAQTQELLNILKNTEEVPVLKHNAAPIAIESAIRALDRAGYDYEAILRSKA